MVIKDENEGAIVITKVKFYSIAYGMATFRSYDRSEDKILWELTVPISKALDIDVVIKSLGYYVTVIIKSGILQKVENP